jgi:hypothetical protein
MIRCCDFYLCKYLIIFVLIKIYSNVSNSRIFRKKSDECWESSNSYMFLFFSFTVSFYHIYWFFCFIYFFFFNKGPNIIHKDTSDPKTIQLNLMLEYPVLDALMRDLQIYPDEGLLNFIFIFFFLLNFIFFFFFFFT